MGFLQQEGIRTVISDPVINRNMEKLTQEESKVIRSARRSAKSKSGKELLKSRGMHLERPFAHILDAGGARRTTLRGSDNLNKRFKFSAAIYNLSQLMRKLLGVGTPKQWAAWGKALFYLFWRLLLGGLCEFAGNMGTGVQKYGRRLVARVEVMAAAIFCASPTRLNYGHCSTGC
jgi:hypothetical protein